MTTSSPLRFRVFIALAMASGAMSIDSILPAFAKIRHDLGLAAGSAATARLITAFFIGNAVGQIPFGILADRFGRRIVMFASIGVFLVGVGVVAVSSQLGPMLVGRVIWGFGSAGLRVAAMAMVRDRFVGAEMAREMAFMTAVFIIVPVFAPLLGSLVIAHAPWRAVLVLSAGLVFVLAVLSWQAPESLATGDRQPLRLRQIGIAAGAIVRSRAALTYTVLLTAVFGAFTSYLASSERIVGDIFNRKSQFPYLFGGIGVCMGINTFLIGKRVERFGLRRMIRWTSVLFAAGSIVTLIIALAAGGRPSFWPFWLALAVQLTMFNSVYPNSNSAAMEPVGHVAGTASAVIGTLATLVGSVIGALIDRAYDATVRPMTISFALAGVLAAALAWSVRDDTP